MLPKLDPNTVSSLLGAWSTQIVDCQAETKAFSSDLVTFYAQATSVTTTDICKKDAGGDAHSDSQSPTSVGPSRHHVVVQAESREAENTSNLTGDTPANCPRQASAVASAADDIKLDVLLEAMKASDAPWVDSAQTSDHGKVRVTTDSDIGTVVNISEFDTGSLAPEQQGDLLQLALQSARVSPSSDAPCNFNTIDCSTLTDVCSVFSANKSGLGDTAPIASTSPTKKEFSTTVQNEDVLSTTCEAGALLNEANAREACIAPETITSSSYAVPPPPVKDSTAPGRFAFTAPPSCSSSASSANGAAGDRSYSPPSWQDLHQQAGTNNQAFVSTPDCNGPLMSASAASNGTQLPLYSSVHPTAGGFATSCQQQVDRMTRPIYQEDDCDALFPACQYTSCPPTKRPLEFAQPNAPPAKRRYIEPTQGYQFQQQPQHRMQQNNVGQQTHCDPFVWQQQQSSSQMLYPQSSEPRQQCQWQHQERFPQQPEQLPRASQMPSQSAWGKPFPQGTPYLPQQSQRDFTHQNAQQIINFRQVVNLQPGDVDYSASSTGTFVIKKHRKTHDKSARGNQTYNTLVAKAIKARGEPLEVKEIYKFFAEQGWGTGENGYPSNGEKACIRKAVSALEYFYKIDLGRNNNKWGLRKFPGS